MCNACVFYHISKMLHVNPDRPSTAGGIRSRTAYKTGGASRQVDGGGGGGQDVGNDSHTPNMSQRYTGATADQPLRPKYEKFIFYYGIIVMSLFHMFNSWP